jgi:hypothetical protein
MRWEADLRRWAGQPLLGAGAGVSLMGVVSLADEGHAPAFTFACLFVGPALILAGATMLSDAADLFRSAELSEGSSDVSPSH